MTGGWGEVALAFGAFLATHAVPARPAIRRALVVWLGERLYLALYAAVSLAVLAWLVSAAGRAPYLPLWHVAPWQKWAPNLAMPLAALLVALGAGAVNPLSFGGRAPQAFDPERPGIAGIARHPLLLALALWSASHIVPNGDLAHVLLFGSFAGFALLGMRALDRRRRREWGAETWSRLARNAPLFPRRRAFPAFARFPAARLAAGLAVYVLLMYAHGPVLGVTPWIGT